MSVCEASASVGVCEATSTSMSSTMTSINVEEAAAIDAQEMNNAAISEREGYTSEEEVTKSFQCQECHWTFNSAASLKKHAKTHLIPKPFNCTFCPKQFGSKSGLDNHLMRHTGERPYECHNCTKTFASRSVLIMHMRSHTGEQPYQCLVCGARFTQSASLANHRRIHTGEMPFTCEICHKKFKHKAAYRTHMAAHKNAKGEMKECSVCHKKYTAFKLKYHIRTHTKTFNCAECGENFHNKNVLENHIYSKHIQHEPYECKICGKKFPGTLGFKQHIETHDSNRGSRCHRCGLWVLSRMSKHTKKYCWKLKPRKFLSHLCKHCGKQFSRQLAYRHYDDCPKEGVIPSFFCDFCQKECGTMEEHVTHLLSYVDRQNPLYECIEERIEHIISKGKNPALEIRHALQQTDHYKQHYQCKCLQVDEHIIQSRSHQSKTLHQKQCKLRQQQESAEAITWSTETSDTTDTEINDGEDNSVVLTSKDMSNDPSLIPTSTMTNDPSLIPISNSITNDNNLLKVHIRSKHSTNQPYECKTCNKTFLGTLGCKQHIATCWKLKPEKFLSHLCKHCGKQFTSKVTYHHYDNCPKEGVTPSFFCDFCKKECGTMEDHVAHLLSYVDKQNLFHKCIEERVEQCISEGKNPALEIRHALQQSGHYRQHYGCKRLLLDEHNNQSRSHQSKTLHQKQCKLRQQQESAESITSFTETSDTTDTEMRYGEDNSVPTSNNMTNDPSLDPTSNSLSNDNNLLKVHIHSKQLYECKICSKKVLRTNLIQHIETHDSNRGSRCHRCGLWVLTRMSKHTKKQCWKIKPRKFLSHLCKHCGKQFSTKLAYRHYDDCPKEGVIPSFFCDFCQKECGTMEEHVAHLLSYVDRQNPLYKCIEERVEHFISKGKNPALEIRDVLQETGHYKQHDRCKRLLEKDHHNNQSQRHRAQNQHHNKKQRKQVEHQQQDSSQAITWNTETSERTNSGRRDEVNNVTNEPSLVSTPNRMTNEPSLVPTSNRMTNEPSLVSTSNRMTNEPSLVPTSNRMTNEPSFVSNSNRMTNEPSLVPTSNRMTNEPSFVPTSNRMTNEPRLVPTSINESREPSIIPISNKENHEMTVVPDVSLFHTKASSSKTRDRKHIPTLNSMNGDLSSAFTSTSVKFEPDLIPSPTTSTDVNMEGNVVPTTTILTNESSSVPSTTTTSSSFSLNNSYSSGYDKRSSVSPTSTLIQYGADNLYNENMVPHNKPSLSNPIYQHHGQTMIGSNQNETFPLEQNTGSAHHITPNWTEMGGGINSRELKMPNIHTYRTDSMSFENHNWEATHDFRTAVANPYLTHAHPLRKNTEHLEHKSIQDAVNRHKDFSVKSELDCGKAWNSSKLPYEENVEMRSHKHLFSVSGQQIGIVERNNSKSVIQGLMQRQYPLIDENEEVEVKEEVKEEVNCEERSGPDHCDAISEEHHIQSLLTRDGAINLKVEHQGFY